MNRKQLASLRERLQKRRRELVEVRDAAERGAQEVREGRTDPEYEEGAQADHVEYTLNTLSDAQRRELILIDAALARMDGGGYGTCVDCGQVIPFERLEALPFAVRDADCAAAIEMEHGRQHAPTL